MTAYANYLFFVLADGRVVIVESLTVKIIVILVQAIARSGIATNLLVFIVGLQLRKGQTLLQERTGSLHKSSVIAVSVTLHQVRIPLAASARAIERG